jgi:hypothetical protein
MIIQRNVNVVHQAITVIFCGLIQYFHENYFFASFILIRHLRFK